MISDVPNGFEAHKLINISLGKIAASRSGKTGASLHKSLLVASVLHKARYVYLEEAHHYHTTIFCPPQGQPEEFVPDPPRAPTPLPEVTVTPVITPAMPVECGDDESYNNNNFNESNNYSNNCISEECKARLEDSGENSDYENDLLNHNRKRRRVSDQETEAAVSSILPKRLKPDSEQCAECVYNNDPPYKYETKIVCSCGFEISSCQCTQSRSAVARGDEEEEEEEEEEDDEEEICNMEVDHITSLVSIFSFNQQQQQSDLCAKQAHHQADAVGPPVLALTA